MRGRMTVKSASRRDSVYLERLYQGFPDSLDRFSWVLNWADLGLPYYHVYVIGPADGNPVKVGISNYCEKRLAHLQVGNWNPLFVHECGWLETSGAARKLEYKVHRLLEGCHLSGEWFALSADDAIQEVRRVATGAGMALHEHVPDGLKDVVFDYIRGQMPVLDNQTPSIVRYNQAREKSLARHGVRPSVVNSLRVPFLAELE